MYGERSTQFLRLHKTTVHTNLEAVAILVATGVLAHPGPQGVLFALALAFGTGLHLGGHWLVSIAFGKNIDRMVLTRAGRIDYSGDEPRFVEALLRISAGPSVNLLCAIAAYALLPSFGGVTAELLSTFAGASAVLAAVNFFPAVPLDGGLLVQTILQRVTSAKHAEWIATIIALVTAAAIWGAFAEQWVLVYVALVISWDNLRKMRMLRTGD